MEHPMRRIILSIAAAAVIGTSLVAAAPAKADWPYYGGGYYHSDWHANEWREHQYWAWRRHMMWHQWQEQHGYYGHPGYGWYR
jgi:hypothetical protein